MLPFLSLIPVAAQAIGKIFGGASKASAEQDAAKQQAVANWNDQQLRQFLAGQNAQTDLGRLDLDRKRYDTDARSAENAQALQRYGQQQDAQFKLGDLDLGRNQLDLQRQKFDADTSASTLKRAMVASLLGNMTPQTFSMPGVPTMTSSGGGLLAALQNNPALAEMIAARHQPTAAPSYQGGQVLKAPTLQGLTATDPYRYGGAVAMPTLTDPTQMRSGGNKFLNALSMASSVLGGMQPLFDAAGATSPSRSSFNGFMNPSLLPGQNVSLQAPRI